MTERSVAYDWLRDGEQIDEVAQIVKTVGAASGSMARGHAMAPTARRVAAVPLPYDLLIQRGSVFDGTGARPRIADVGVRDGRVVAISDRPLLSTEAAKVMDATGLWVMPGFIDIHTHYDAELLLEPGLQESVRHGITTCFVGSCSISMIYSDAEDASDIFTRVESIPREYVLPALREKKTWNDAAGYVAHLRSLPLGPNIASYMGHSDLRAAAMGLGRSVDPKAVPSEAELRWMERQLEDGIDHGLLGMSGMTNPWDKVDGDRFRSSALPSVYARWSEYRRLHKVLRRRGAGRVFPLASAAAAVSGLCRWCRLRDLRRVSRRRGRAASEARV